MLGFLLVTNCVMSPEFNMGLIKYRLPTLRLSEGNLTVIKRWTLSNEKV